MQQIEVALLGGFAVTVDSRPVPADAWPQRRAADLVKLLALAPSHRLPRDRVIDALWPQLDSGAGGANLHKAASYARRAMGDRDAIVLRAGIVELAPGARVVTDVERFEEGSLDAYGGVLLPDDQYEEWTAEARERLRERRLEALRRQGRWDEVLDEAPADEEAHRALMRGYATSGDRAGAARQFRRLRDELARLGLQPSDETLALQRELSTGPAVRAVPLPRTPMHGREHELTVALAAVRAAHDGSGGTLIVRGGMGVGKTRLIESTLEEAAALGFHTLRGSAHDDRTPYAPFAEALDPLAAERPDLLASMNDSAQAALALLLPSVPATGDGAAADRHRVFSAVGELLVRAAEERGLLIALDDLQGADEATAGLLHYIARTAPRHRLCMVVGMRDEGASPEVASVRSKLLEQRATVEVALGALDRAAVAALAETAAGRPLGDEALRAIERSSAGNPFFVEELAATVDVSGEVTIPRRVQHLLDARLDRLDPLGDRLLAALAVMDDVFTRDELADLAGGGADAVTAAVERALAAGVLEAARGAYRFHHPLLRERLVARLPEDALRRAHAEAAARLTADDAPPERIAHHLLRAGSPADAVPLLARAATWAANVGAYRDGAEWARLALEHAGPEQRPDLLVLHARLLHGSGDPRAPLAYADAIAAGPVEREPPLRAQQARAFLAAGNTGAAAAALDAVEGREGEAIAEVTVLRGMVAWHRGDWGRSRALSAQAATLSADPGELADLRAMNAHVEGVFEGHAQDQLTDVWGEPGLAGRVFDAYLCVSEYVLTSGDPYDRIAAFAKRLRAEARQAGARRGEAFATTVLGEAELFTGNLEAARDHLSQAARLSRTTGAVGGEALARMRLGETLMHLGDLGGASAQLDEALELAHVSAIPQHLLFLVYGAIVRLPGGPADALDAIDRAEAVFDPRWVCGFCPTGYHIAAAAACARARDLERSREFLARAQHGARLWPTGPWPAAVAEARAELQLASGERAEAALSLRRAVEGYADAGQVLNEARARDALAALERRPAGAAR